MPSQSVYNGWFPIEEPITLAVMQAQTPATFEGDEEYDSEESEEEEDDGVKFAAEVRDNGIVCISTRYWNVVPCTSSSCPQSV